MATKPNDITGSPTAQLVDENFDDVYRELNQRAEGSPTTTSSGRLTVIGSRDVDTTPNVWSLLEIAIPPGTQLLLIEILDPSIGLIYGLMVNSSFIRLIPTEAGEVVGTSKVRIG